MDETLELTPEEQESLAIGEEMAAQQEQMLAGKFESAEQLEKAYLELQSKLGQKSQAPEEGEEAVTETDDGNAEEAQDESAFQGMMAEAAQAFLDKGEIPEDMLSKFDAMSSREIVNELMRMPQPQAQVQDLSDADVNTIQNTVGGKEAYESIMKWASESMPQGATASFDSLVEAGDAGAIQLAVMGLQAAYQQANGFEGNMYSGRSAREMADVFRSQAEVVQAMSDPRYDSDPAFRQDVFDKLSRSDV
jgi:hypothetical protein